MDHGSSTRNLPFLAIESVLFFIPITLLAITLHELGHGIGATLVGARFDGFHISLFGGISYLSNESSPLRSALSSVAGSGFSLLIGLLITYLVLPKIGRWTFKLFWMYLGFITTIDLPRSTVTLLTSNPSADFYNITARTGLPTIVVGTLGLLLLFLVLYIYSKVFGEELGKYFMLGTYRQRLLVFLTLLGLPIFVSSAVAMISPAGSGVKLGTIIAYCILAFFSCVLMSLRKPYSSSPMSHLPRVAVGATLLILVVAVWLIVFGTRIQPRGLLWNAPEEKSVASSNVVIHLNRELCARVDFLMRPTIMEFFWRQQRRASPNWNIYEAFVRDNSARLLGPKMWSLLDRIQDDSVEFSNYGDRDHGARRISISYAAMQLAQPNEANVSALDLKCDSLCNSFGLNTIEIVCDSGLSISDYQQTPTQAAKPAVQEPNRLVLGVQTLMSTESIRLSLVRR